MRRAMSVLMLAMLGLQAAPWSAVGAQRTTERSVSDSLRCPRCRIERTVEARLHSTALEGEIDEMPLGVRRSARGEIWVLSQGLGPRTYDPRGAFTRAIGRTGRGPGEYSAVDDVVWLPGDSVLVVDGINRRATVIAQDGRVRRTIQMPTTVLNLFVLEWPSRLFGSATLATPDAAGHGLHLMNLAGASARITRSFSPGAGAQRASDRVTTYHYVAGAAGGGITPCVRRVLVVTHGPTEVRPRSPRPVDPGPGAGSGCRHPERAAVGGGDRVDGRRGGAHLALHPCPGDHLAPGVGCAAPGIE